MKVFTGWKLSKTFGMKTCPNYLRFCKKPQKF